MLPALRIEQVKVEGDPQQATLFVHPDLPFFAGHFPEAALVPAALQIDWLLQLFLSSRSADAALPIVRLAKFLKPLLPGTEVHLSLSPLPGEALLGEVSSCDGVHSRVTFDMPAE